MLLFNIAGYRIVLQFFANKATKTINASIDNKTYKDSELIEITTALNMPYIADKDFEETVGETTIGGVHYQYVKRKVVHNVLHLYCLPNIEKTAIAKTQIALEKINVDDDKNTTNKKSTVNILKIISADYVVTICNNFIESLPATNLVNIYFNYASFYTQHKPSQIGKPPKSTIV